MNCDLIKKITGMAFEAGIDPVETNIREDGYQFITRNCFTRLAVVEKLKEVFNAVEVEIMTTADGKLVYNIIKLHY